MVRLSNRDQWAEGVLFLLFSSMMAVMVHFTPLAFDDYAFISLYLDHNGGSPEFSLKGLAGFFNEMRTYDNSRIANQLAPIFGLMQPWKNLFAILTGLLCGSIALLILRFANLNRNKALAFSSVWLLMLVALPWRNSILVMDYALNYIFSTFVTLLFLLMMIRRWRKGVARRVAMMLFAIVAGGFHEGFAFPSICGLGVFILTRRFRLNAGWWMTFALYIISALWFALSPGILARVGRELTEQALSVPLYKYLADLWLTIIVCATLAFYCVRKGFREVMKDETLVVFSVIMIVGALLSIIVEHTGRTAFWPEICAIIIMLRLSKSYIERLGTRIAIVTALICDGLLTAQNIYSLSWIKRIYDENEKIMAILFPGGKGESIRAYGYSNLQKECSGDIPSGTVFMDIIMPEQMPLATLYIPLKSLWVTGFQYQTLNGMYNPRKIAIVPTSLEKVEIKSDSIINLPYRCVSEEEDIFATEDAFFTNDIPDMNTYKIVSSRVKLRNGHEIEHCPGFAIRFETEKGDTLIYLKPYRLSVKDIDSLSISGYTPII